jgi:hypothetical protein
VSKRSSIAIRAIFTLPLHHDHGISQLISARFKEMEQAAKRPRLSKPKVRTGCSTCKYVIYPVLKPLHTLPDAPSEYDELNATRSDLSAFGMYNSNRMRGDFIMLIRSVKLYSLWVEM